MDQKMTPLEKIEAIGNVLEKLADLPGGGRAKCGLIWVMGDLLEKLNQDILIMQEQISDNGSSGEEPEIRLEVIDNDNEEDDDKENG